MAKFDVSKIKGYSEMTEEQKKSLEEYEFPDPDYSGYVKKELFDKTASEAAEWKKKHNALLSEEERKKQDSEEEVTSLRNRIAELEKNETVSKHKAQFLSLGYDDALASETAQAMADGNVDKVFANQKKFLENHDKAYKAQLMGGTSVPPAGSIGTSKTDYSKLIEDARSRGDMPEVAYYTRLSEQEKQNK